MSVLFAEAILRPALGQSAERKIYQKVGRLVKRSNFPHRHAAGNLERLLYFCGCSELFNLGALRYGALRCPRSHGQLHVELIALDREVDKSATNGDAGSSISPLAVSDRIN